MSLRDDFFSVKDQPFRDITVKGWGKVRIRRLTSGQWLDIFGVDGVEAAGKRAADTAARCIVNVVHDPETDERVFTDDDIEQIKAIPTERLGAMLQIISAMREMPADDDVLKSAKKNSRRTRASASTPSLVSSSIKASQK